MIRALRHLSEWLRNRQHERELDALAAAIRADREARQLEWLRQADAHRIEARRLFAEAQAVECFAERHSLYCQALAAECRGEACHALAGGDAESAAQHTMEAAGYDLRAGAPMPVPTQPAEAAHA